MNGLAGLAVRFLNEAQAYTGACRNRMDRNGPLDRRADRRRTAGAGASGGSGRPLPTATSSWSAGWPSSSSSAPPRHGRHGRGRWPSPRWAPPSSSPSTPSTARHASSSPTTPTSIAAPNGDAAWPWPEPRLTYANAVLPEAMIAAGVALDDATLRQRGLDLLAWLLDYETADGHLSPTPVGGQRAPATSGPAFDQQPIEVAALADACARAAAVDAGPIWPDGVRPPRPGSRATTTQDSSCGTRRPAADSTVCTPTG